MTIQINCKIRISVRFINSHLDIVFNDAMYYNSVELIARPALVLVRKCMKVSRGRRCVASL